LGIDAPKEMRVTRDNHFPGTTPPGPAAQGAAAPVVNVEAGRPHHVAE
jgi:hypothetical protein